MGTGTCISALALLLAAPVLFATDAAYVLSQPNLTVIGSSERSVSVAAAEICRHREFLESSIAAFRARRLPLTVVEVSDADFRSFGLPASVPAFYVQSGLEGLIAVREPMLRYHSAIAHEVFHAVVLQTGWQVMQGVEEGMAEYFSTASYDVRGRVSLGATSVDRIHRLQSGDLGRLASTLNWRSASGAGLALGSEESSRAYDASWAAAHWLLQASGASLSDAGSWLTPGPELLQRMQRDLPHWLHSNLAETVQLNAPPDEGVAEPRQAADGLRESALIRILMQCNQVSAAERIAAEIQPGSADNGAIHAALGRLALRVGRTEEASTELARATDLGVDDASTWRNLALCQSRLGRHAATAASLKRVLALDPNDDDARLVRASVLIWLDQIDEGLSELRLVAQAPRGRDAEYARLIDQGRVLTDRRNMILARNAASTAAH